MAPIRLVLSVAAARGCRRGQERGLQLTRWANPDRPKVRSPVTNAEAVRLYRVWLDRAAGGRSSLPRAAAARQPGWPAGVPSTCLVISDVLIELLEGSRP